MSTPAKSITVVFEIWQAGWTILFEASLLNHGVDVG